MINGSFRILRLWGIDVFVHWSWLLIALYEINSSGRYDSKVWNAVEYLSLFAIVTIHEFGHALAAKSVGGRAEQIVLWPLGGIAFARLPARPGAHLWTTVAGPLVNVALVPVLALAGVLAGLPSAGEHAGLMGWLHSMLLMFQTDVALISQGHWLTTLEVRNLFSWIMNDASDPQRFVAWIALINLSLLLLNLLPIYPLDGGRIFQSLLWFVVGMVPSLVIAGFLGLVLAAGVCAWALYNRDIFLLLIGLFIATSAWGAFRTRRPPGEPDSPEGVEPGR